MGELTEWLNIMLGEISRKQDDAVRARQEQVLRDQPQPVPDPKSPPRETR